MKVLQVMIVNIKSDVKHEIIRTLSIHSEGLTIQNLADELKVSRHTVIRYVSELIGEGVVHRREIGSATLHYLKSTFEKIEKLGRSVPEGGVK